MDLAQHFDIKDNINGINRTIKQKHKRPSVRNIFTYLDYTNRLGKGANAQFLKSFKQKYGACVAQTIVLLSVLRSFNHDVKAQKVSKDIKGQTYPIYKNRVVFHVCASEESSGKKKLLDLSFPDFPVAHQETSDMSDEILTSHAYSNLGVKTIDDKEALKLFDISLKFFGDNNLTKLNLANRYIQMGKINNALKLLKELKTKLPKDVLTTATSASLYQNLNLTDSAEEKIDDALQVDPKNPFANAIKGTLLIEKNMPKEAMKHLDLASNYFDDLHFLSNKMICHLMLDEARDARVIFNSIVGEADTQTLMQLGKIIQKFPDAIDLAHECFQRVYDLSDHSNKEAEAYLQTFKKFGLKKP